MTEQTEIFDAKTNHHQQHTVKVMIDNRKVELTPGVYCIADLKELLGVPLEYELEIIEHGEFRPLEDAGQINIEKHEEFISHVRCGASS